MEYVDSTDWKRLFPILTEGDVKYYTFQLLKARSSFHLPLTPPHFTII